MDIQKPDTDTSNVDSNTGGEEQNDLTSTQKPMEEEVNLNVENDEKNSLADSYTSQSDVITPQFTQQPASGGQRVDYTQAEHKSDPVMLRSFNSDVTDALNEEVTSEVQVPQKPEEKSAAEIDTSDENNSTDSSEDNKDSLDTDTVETSEVADNESDNEEVTEGEANGMENTNTLEELEGIDSFGEQAPDNSGENEVGGGVEGDENPLATPEGGVENTEEENLQENTEDVGVDGLKEEILRIENEYASLGSDLGSLAERIQSMGSDIEKTKVEIATVQESLDPILAEEQKIETSLKEIEEKEQGATTPDERHAIEEQGWKLEDQRSKTEQDKWKISEGLEKIKQELTEKEGMQETQKGQEDEIRERMTILDTEKQRKELEVKLGEVIQKKRVFESELESVSGVKREDEGVLSAIESEEKDIEKQQQELESQESNVSAGEEERSLEQRRQEVSGQRREIEKRRWEKEKELQTHVSQVEQLESDIVNASNEEEEINQKISSL